MSREASAGALARDLTDYIERGIPDDSTFSRLARRLFAYHFAWNEPYRRFCRGRGVHPESITDWREIPAAPAVAFKRFALTCAPESDCTAESGGRIFHSSGTTGSETSRHYLDSAALSLYRTSLTAGYRHFIPEPNHQILALMAPPSEAPHSSLSFMLEELQADFWWGNSWIENLAALLYQLSGPVTVFGTAFAWIHFFDSVTDRLQLPEGSVIIETGGFKGRSREVSRDELYALFKERLGVPSSHCVSEYGMSEMASQFYDSALVDAKAARSRKVRKTAPFWLKTRLLDPVTGEETALGQPGLLAHFDLANLNSVLAIQTEDYGIAAEDGDGFILLGRAPGAVLRGCSLTAEDSLYSR